MRTGSTKQIAFPIKFSNSDVDAYNTTGGAVGAECSQVLKDLLGMADEEITGLRENGTLMSQ